jgi:hypothetical protein
MKKVSEPQKVTRRVRVDSSPRVRDRDADRVRVVRVAGSAGRPVRWHVSRPDAKN